MSVETSVGIVYTKYFTFAEPPNEMVLEGGQKLDSALADMVASAMKERTAQREKTLPNHLLSRYLALLVSLSGNNILQ